MTGYYLDPFTRITGISFPQAGASCDVTFPSNVRIREKAIITGSGFGTTPGSVVLYENSDQTGASATQSVTAWSDTQIEFYVEQGTLSLPDAVFGFVTIGGDECGPYPTTISGLITLGTMTARLVAIGSEVSPGLRPIDFEIDPDYWIGYEQKYDTITSADAAVYAADPAVEYRVEQSSNSSIYVSVTGESTPETIAQALIDAMAASSDDIFTRFDYVLDGATIRAIRNIPGSSSDNLRFRVISTPSNYNRLYNQVGTGKFALPGGPLTYRNFLDSDCVSISSWGGQIPSYDSQAYGDCSSKPYSYWVDSVTFRTISGGCNASQCGCGGFFKNVGDLVTIEWSGGAANC